MMVICSFLISICRFSWEWHLLDCLHLLPIIWWFIFSHAKQRVLYLPLSKIIQSHQTPSCFEELKESTCSLTFAILPFRFICWSTKPLHWVLVSSMLWKAAFKAFWPSHFSAILASIPLEVHSACIWRFLKFQFAICINQTETYEASVPCDQWPQRGDINMHVSRNGDGASRIYIVCTGPIPSSTGMFWWCNVRISSGNM